MYISRTGNGSSISACTRFAGTCAKARQPIQIIIGEGRDPSDYEIDMMLDEALGVDEELFAEAAE